MELKPKNNVDYVNQNIRKCDFVNMIASTHVFVRLCSLQTTFSGIFFCHQVVHGKI